jgi:transcription initiation factor TFIIB
LKQTSLHDRGSGPVAQTDFQDIIPDLHQVAQKLGLTHEVRKRATSICSDIKASGFGRGINHRTLAAAALYIACRERKVPVTLREFADASDADPRDVGRCYLSILENLHISRPNLNEKGYVYHIALKKRVSDQALKLSQEIINQMSSKGLGGRNPMTLAAAALYIASCDSGENVTQAEVAEAAGVGEESVRECCKEIRTLAKPSPS